MKANKLITAAAAAALLLTGAYADDFDFGSDDFSFDDFGGDSGSSASSPVEVGGKVEANVRDYVSTEGEESAADTGIDASVDGQVTVNYSGSKADASMTLDFNPSTINSHPEDILNEASATVYLGNFKLEAGKMKSVWGKGDKLHVIDNFNSDDYSDFIIPDYLDRRLATPMVKASYSFNLSTNALSNMKIEGIYTPFLPVDRFATSGNWVPAQVTNLTNKVTAGATDRVATAFKNYTTAETEMGAIMGALNTMNANVTAAKTALDTATTTLNNVNTLYNTVYQKLYDGAYSQYYDGAYTQYYNGAYTQYYNGAYAQVYQATNNATVADAQAKAYAEAQAKSYAETNAATYAKENATTYAKNNQEAQYEAYMKGLDSSYSSTYEKDTDKATAAVQATSCDYQEANGVYTEALKKYGYSNLDDAKAKLTSDLTDKSTKYMYALTMANALNADSSIIYPDTNTFKYGQAGARFTASSGSVDWGLSYYYGHYKQPSVNYDKMETYLDKYLANETITEDDKFLAYDQKQTFGIEAATILWHFNVRGEACYNLTEDVDGTNPWVHNNSIQWLGGFDIDLPFWNMNVNIQEYGTYILNNDQITGSSTELFDVDYNTNGYSNNKLVANITTSFDNDKIAPEVTVMYGIENGDLVIMPKFVVKPTSELALTASGMYMWNRDENSEFYAWRNNNFVQLGACLTF